MPRFNCAADFWSKVRIGAPDECWPWTKSQCGAGWSEGRGYGSVRMFGGPQKSHRVAWRLTNGDIPDGLHVLHHCDYKPCCNPKHLYLGTHQQNMRDRDVRHLRTAARGERHGRAKLTEQDVIKIRQLLRDGRSQTSIAPQFGVSQVAISFIARGQHWIHV